MKKKVITIIIKGSREKSPIKYHKVNVFLNSMVIT